MAATQERPVSALLSAAEDVVQAGQQAMLDRFELLRTEATTEARELARDGAMLGAASGLAALGWVFTAVALALLLAEVLAPWLAALAVGLPHLALGLALAASAARRFRRQTHQVGQTLSNTVFQSPLHD